MYIVISEFDFLDILCRFDTRWLRPPYDDEGKVLTVTNLSVEQRRVLKTGSTRTRCQEV